MRHVRSSADASTAEPAMTTSAATAAASLCSPAFCAWYCSTALAVARIAARSMIEGISSFRRRRAIRSTLVTLATGSDRPLSTVRALGACENDLATITGKDAEISTALFATGTKKLNGRDCSAGAVPEPMRKSTSVIPSSGALTR